MKLATAQQMRNIDRRAIDELGVPSTLLMENAARAVAGAALEIAGRGIGRKAAVFCGSGNNGGDGICAARVLTMAGIETRAFFVGSPERMTDDAREMERRFSEIGGALEEFVPGSREIESFCAGADVIIDAIFGTGLNSEVRGAARAAIELINLSGRPVVAADIPSGVDADTGRVLGAAVRAVKSITFALPKTGHFTGEGSELCGEIKVVDIGIPPIITDGFRSDCFAVYESDVDEIIPRRKRDGHKGNFGKVLMICGSRGYTGAAALASRAAVRTGSGLVFLGVPESIYQIEAAKSDEAMVFSLPDDGEGRLSARAAEEILKRLEGCDVCLAGPGLGRSAGVEEIVKLIIGRSKAPVVLDADGINALSGNINILREAGCPVVLTPHEGEFARLCGGAADGSRLDRARSFAQEYGCILTLKGRGTITALPDGAAYVNTTGNPGMAKGGSGDVLAGMLSSLIGQGIAPEKAAAAAVWLHGRAGDQCASRLGEYGMTPSDMIDEIPFAMKKY